MKRLLALLLLLTGFTCIPASAQDNEPVYRQLNAKAIDAFRAGKFAEAEEFYKKALESYAPEKSQYDRTIKRNLAVLYRRAGRIDEAKTIETALGDHVGEATRAETGQVLPVITPTLMPLAEMGKVSVVPGSKPALPKQATAPTRPTPPKTDSRANTPMSPEDTNVLIDFCSARARNYALSKHPAARKIYAGSTRKAFKTGNDLARVEVNCLVTEGTKITDMHVNFNLSIKGGEIAVLGITSVTPQLPPAKGATIRTEDFRPPGAQTPYQPVSSFPEAQQPRENPQQDQPPPFQEPARSILSGFGENTTDSAFSSPISSPLSAPEPEPIQSYTPAAPPTPSGG